MAQPYLPDFRIWIGDIEITGYVHYGEITMPHNGLDDYEGVGGQTRPRYDQGLDELVDVDIHMKVPRSMLTVTAQPEPLPALPHTPKALPETLDA